MAKQHFYSRVPARGSLYNRSDGFDTFAHSEGMSREFIERELSPVYENKLTKQDAEAVRTGRMPVVYSQSCLRSGKLAQSCISYLPKDYTGERSAYLCHSLILSEEETKKVFFGEGNGLINPKMFVADPGAFDLATQVATENYPEKNYTPGKAADPQTLVTHYDAATVKNFLFAVLNVLCGKGKTVYFKLSCKDDKVSREALKMMDMVASVLPFHLRKNISFVSYVTDPQQYNHVKIKCVSGDCPEAVLSKGVFVDFGTNLVTGMPAADVVAKMPVNFFYTLLEDATIRGEFLRFVDKAVQAVPELEKLNAKTLTDLVFLFGGASGLYDQNKILPTDDDVLTFLTSYEKYRAALGEESRRNVYKCLERYPQRHVAIPKSIFAKVTRLYGSEEPSAKRIAMNVVLELIHTDVMRDKLFTFLKNNYDDENEDIRTVIIADLCRVYYGGFLQPQILDFFTKKFTQEQEEARNMIFEKLMLTIRTPSVQEKTLAFLQQHYEALTAKQKVYLYETIYEMLPMCDELSAALILRINAQMETESEGVQKEVAKRMTELLAADYKKKDHKLMALMCAEHGFCQDLVLSLAFGPWSTRKIYEEYIALLAEKKLVEKVSALVRIAKALPGEKTEELLASSVEALFAGEMETANLYRWMEAETLVKTELAEHCPPVAQLLCGKIIEPAVICRLEDVFDVKLGKDGLDKIIQHAKENGYLRGSERYKDIATLRQLISAVEATDVPDAFRKLAALLQEERDQSRMADYLRTVYLDWENQPQEQALLWDMCCAALQEGQLLSEEVYMECKARCARLLMDEQPKLTGDKLTTEAGSKAAERILRYLMLAGKVEPGLLEATCQNTEKLGIFLKAFCADYGRGVDKWMQPILEDAQEPLKETVLQLLETSKPQKTNIFTKLFGKK